MGFLKTSASAIGKLMIVVALAGAFLVGLLGVVYLSLQGEEIKVPAVVGKEYSESEKELSQLGLKIKRRAFRFSQEKPNTILEQSPRSGEPVKTGQIIFVVVSQANPESTEAPATVNKDTDDSSSDDGLSNAPKKSNKNSNVKKPAQTTRDVTSNKSNTTANSNTGSSDISNSKPAANSGLPAPSGNKNNSANKTPPNPTATPKPSASKTPTSGDLRTRRVPN